MLVVCMIRNHGTHGKETSLEDTKQKTKGNESVPLLNKTETCTKSVFIE
jgi:hypothetical protein